MNKDRSSEGRLIRETTDQPAKTRFKRVFRALLAAALALLFCGFIAPQINAARFSGSIRRALESSLGRRVQFEEAHLSIFSGPGFSLERVVIGEDPRYGIEPFAYVPTLQARLRLDKLLEGQIQFVSLRLVEPSLNLVRRTDGQWNVVELMQRLSAPRRALLSFFPSFEVSDGRVDFKFGTRKTTLYISESDLSIYPERSGKVYIRFSGSPARTDRAGMGFGRFRANVNWFLNASAAGNQIQAELNLDPSNLSELTTLVEGHDLGVHGTVSSSLWIEGPPTALSVAGELRLNDVHRWDLLPSSGEEWTVHFSGGLDLPAHRFEIRTVPSSKGQPSPVTMHLRVSNFLAKPASSVVAELKNAPFRNILPLAERMGVQVPAGVDINGVLDGAIGYSSEAGWTGGLTVNDAEAVLEGAPTLRARSATVKLTGNRVHFYPAVIDAGGGGTLTLAGNYSFSEQQTTAFFGLTNVPVLGVKSLTKLWFGGLATLSAMQAGDLTGQLSYTHGGTTLTPDGTPAPSLWSGEFELQDGTISIPGLAVPLERARGKVVFNNSNFELTHLTASLGQRILHASYRYSLPAKHTEHARIEFPAVELSELESVLSSANHKQDLWDRLRFFRRTFPAWLSTRDLDGDLVVDHLLAEGQALGSLKSHFLWQAATLALSGIDLRLAQGRIAAEGSINLGSNIPEWQFSAKASDYPWSGGSLDAEGQFSSTGAGKDLLRNLTGGGSFNGRNLSFSDDDNFELVSGLFRFSFADGWPDLRLSNIQASEDGDQWSGEGATQSDGKLLVDLTHGDRQIHLVSSLAGANNADPVSVLPRAGTEATALFRKLKLR